MKLNMKKQNERTLSGVIKEKLNIIIIVIIVFITIGLLGYFFFKKSPQYKCVIGFIKGKTVYLDNRSDTTYKPFVHKIDNPEIFFFDIDRHNGAFNADNPYFVFIDENSNIDTCFYNPEYRRLRKDNLFIDNDTFDLSFINVSNVWRKGDSLCEIVKNIIVKLEFRYDDSLEINPIGNDYKDFITLKLLDRKDLNRKKIKEFENMISNKQGILFFSSNTFYFYEIKDGFIGATKRIRYRPI